LQAGIALCGSLPAANGTNATRQSELLQRVNNETGRVEIQNAEGYLQRAAKKICEKKDDRSRSNKQIPAKNLIYQIRF
jgi:hypothetical protein